MARLAERPSFSAAADSRLAASASALARGLMAHFRRLVAEALSGLQGSSSAARVIDLGTADAPAAPRRSARANAAAGSVPADDRDASASDVEKHWSATEIGAWLQRHRADDPVMGTSHWYKSVRQAINSLVREGILHMGRLDRFRLAEDAPAARTHTVVVRWNDEDIPVEVASDCTDPRLRDAIGEKIGERLHPSTFRLWYPLSDNLAMRPVDGPLTDLGVGEGSIVRLESFPRADGDGPDGCNSAAEKDAAELAAAEKAAAEKAAAEKAAAEQAAAELATAEKAAAEKAAAEKAAAEQAAAEKAAAEKAAAEAAAEKAKKAAAKKKEKAPAKKAAKKAAAEAKEKATAPSDPLDAHEVIELEAEGEGGWNDDGDGWVNLVRDDAEDDAKDDAATLATTSSKKTTTRATSPVVVCISDDDTDDEAEARAALHAQVVSFAATAGSDEADTRRREAVCARMRAAIARSFPSARLEVFGSGATGLALKDADIDLVVLGVGPVASAMGGGFGRADRPELVSTLRKIEKILRQERLVQRAQGIYTAKVPIIKMHTGAYAVDLTVGAANGLAAVEWIRQQVRAFPPMRPLVLVLKRLLKLHALDDASTGGCGGYLLVSLVVSHLRACGDEAKSAGADLGALLIGFLFRYGRDFDYGRTAVAAGRASGVMRASDLPAAPGPWGRRPMVLAEDPQESGRNITAAAYRFREVKALFHAAGEAMSAEGELTFLTEVAAAATRPPTWNDAEEESDEDPYPIGYTQAEFGRDLEAALPIWIDPEARKNTTGRRQPAASPTGRGRGQGQGASSNAAGKGGGGNGNGKGKGKGSRVVEYAIAQKEELPAPDSEARKNTTGRGRGRGQGQGASSNAAGKGGGGNGKGKGKGKGSRVVEYAVAQKEELPAKGNGKGKNKSGARKRKARHAAGGSPDGAGARKAAKGGGGRGGWNG